jgi:hypothetical protein
MTQQADLLSKIDKLPPKYLGEVIDFVEYLQQKVKNEHYEDEIAAYKAMAADTEREQEAREWCSAYFGPVRQ